MLRYIIAEMATEKLSLICSVLAATQHIIAVIRIITFLTLVTVELNILV